MAEDQPAETGSEPTFVHTPGGTGPLSPRDAARSLTDARAKANAAPSPDKQPERAPPATAAEESAPAADATSPEPEPNGETSETDLKEEAPSLIDPPPSWTSEQRQRWANLDPATQEYLVEYDKKLSSEVSRAQKEAAEQLKGLTSREQAMEQARLQFENLNQTMLQEYMTTLQGDFADIKTMDDVQRLADGDWARYNKWQVHQQRIALKKAQVEDGLQRQAQEAQTKFAKFADEQDKAFIARVPEFANKDRAAELQSAAMQTLRTVGFAEDELTRHWNKQESLSLRDARMQELIHKAARWDAAQEAKKTVTAKKDLPPVQRPGVARQGDSVDAQIQTLIGKSKRATSVNEQLRFEQQITGLRRKAGML